MAKPSVLVIHNRYLQPGGEDAVVAAEVELLRENGHRVLQYSRHNREIGQFSRLRKACLASTTTWDQESYREVRWLIRQERPEVVHCHNLLPLLSPSVYYACAAEGIPVVQTVHNYRLLCAGGNLFRNGERCSGCRASLLTSVRDGCYRQSRTQTAAVALMLGVHRTLGTWRQRVSTYIAPSEFCRAMLVRAGFAAEQIVCKPHFVAETSEPRTGLGQYAIFVGRLSAEKGILQLLRVWQRLKEIPLLVVGDGPLLGEALRTFENGRAGHIRFAGQISHADALARIAEARFLVAPSRCDETFGMAVLEAASCGVPAIVSRHGALRELVREQETGLLFDAEDPEELADIARWAWSYPSRMQEMGRAAHDRCRRVYSAERNYEQLKDIYAAAVEGNQPAHAEQPVQRMSANRPGRFTSHGESLNTNLALEDDHARVPF